MTQLKKISGYIILNQEPVEQYTCSVNRLSLNKGLIKYLSLACQWKAGVSSFHTKCR